MSEPILVVDPGTAWTTAAVVTDSSSELLKEPASGSYCWPTSVALDGETLRVGTVAERRKRADPALYAGQLTVSLRPDRQVRLGGHSYPARELVCVLLAALKAEAERLVRRPVERILVLTAEDGGPGTVAGQEMIASSAAAGFTDVELLAQPAAAAMAPAEQAAQHPGEPGAGETAGGPVLVCDAGASALRLTLVYAQPGQAGTSQAGVTLTACGGGKLDALLTESIGRSRSSKWIRPLIGAQGVAGVRARLDLAELASRIRHQLSDADQAEDTLTPLTPVVRVSRPDLEKMMRPSLSQLSSACRELLGKARDTAPRVMLVGGCARTPAIQRALSSALGRPVPPSPVPELATLQGGTVWARTAAARRVPAVPVPVGLHGLAWPVPGDAARLIGYAVTPGTYLEAGRSLARIRTDDDAIWDLASEAAGIIEQHCAAPGSIVATADMLVVTRRTSFGPADRRPSPLRLAVVTGGQHAAFSPDSRQVATADVAGTVRVWDTETAALLGRFEGPPAPVRPGWLATATDPDGHWLIARFDGHAVVVQDATAGRQLARVAKGNDLSMLHFAGDGRHLYTVEGKRTRIWEVSGRELMSVKERLLGDSGVAISHDGRKLGLVSRAGIEVWDPPKSRAIVRRHPGPPSNGKVWQLAFSPDGAKILLAADLHLELISLPAGETLWSASLAAPACWAEFAPGDGLLAIVSQTARGLVVSLRDAATGGEVSQAGPGEGGGGWARLSPDGRFMVSAEGDNAVLWALAY
jgi:Hsp70 protein